MPVASLSRKYWDGVARRMAAGYHLDPVMAEHKRRVHLDLLQEWCSPGAGSRVLKTDLFEEALGPDQVLIDINEAELTNTVTLITDDGGSALAVVSLCPLRLRSDESYTLRYLFHWMTPITC